MSQFIEMFKGDFPKLSWEECLTIINGKKYDDDYQESGTYPICGSGGIMGYGERMLCPKDTVILGRKGNINSPIYMETDYWIVDTAFCLDVDRTKLHPKYFYFWCKLFDFTRYNKQGVLPSLTKNDLLKIEMPIPPMELQTKFVDIIEQSDKSGFDELKSQFIEMFGGGNWPQKTLGEVGSFTRGGGFQKSDFVEHGIPCIHYGQIHTKFGPFITSHITEISSDLESKTKFASKGDLVIAITSEDTEGSCKSTAWLGDYSVAVGGHAAIYKHSMNPLYISFFFKSTLFNHAKIEYVHGTKVFEIKPDDIAKILVPCPPMSLQNQFSAIAEQADKSGSVLQYMIAC